MPLRAEILVPVCTAVLIVCYPLGLGFEALKKLHSHGGRTTFSELRTGTIIRLLEYLSRLALSGGGCSGRCLFCWWCCSCRWLVVAVGCRCFYWVLLFVVPQGPPGSERVPPGGVRHELLLMVVLWLLLVVMVLLLLLLWRAIVNRGPTV